MEENNKADLEMKLFEKTKIDPDEVLFSLTALDAFDCILNVAEDFCPHVRFEDFLEEEIRKLLNDYVDCFYYCSPEDNAQEREALWLCKDILIKHGGTEKEIKDLGIAIMKCF